MGIFFSTPLTQTLFCPKLPALDMIFNGFRRHVPPLPSLTKYEATQHILTCSVNMLEEPDGYLYFVTFKEQFCCFHRNSVLNSLFTLFFLIVIPILSKINYKDYAQI